MPTIIYDDAQVMSAIKDMPFQALMLCEDLATASYVFNFDTKFHGEYINKSFWEYICQNFMDCKSHAETFCGEDSEVAANITAALAVATNSEVMDMTTKDYERIHRYISRAHMLFRDYIYKAIESKEN